MTLSRPIKGTLEREEIERLVEIRHDLHAHPQLGYTETYASERIQGELTRLGIPFVVDVAQTGVVGWILPENAEACRCPAIALRADMDALPITEATGLPYASRNEGVMHACGHDGHVTILLGVAQLLWQRRADLSCPVKLLFQPAEESGAGAAAMIEAGVLDAEMGGVEVGSSLAIHNWPDLSLGTASAVAGPTMAGMDILRFQITGAGGHAAQPDRSRDLNLAAAALIQGLQSIVSRRLTPTDAAVVSITQINSGQANNILPDKLTMGGTLRYLTDEVRRQIREQIHRIAHGVGLTYDVEITPIFEDGYPPTVNDRVFAQRVAEACRSQDLVVLDHDPPSMAAEDFAFLAQRVPSVYIRLGTATDPGHTPGLHTAQYDFCDALIPSAVNLMAEVVMGERP